MTYLTSQCAMGLLPPSAKAELEVDYTYWLALMWSQKIQVLVMLFVQRTLSPLSHLCRLSNNYFLYSSFLTSSFFLKLIVGDITIALHLHSNFNLYKLNLNNTQSFYSFKTSVPILLVAITKLILIDYMPKVQIINFNKLAFKYYYCVSV